MPAKRNERDLVYPDQDKCRALRKDMPLSIKAIEAQGLGKDLYYKILAGKPVRDCSLVDFVRIFGGKNWSSFAIPDEEAESPVCDSFLAEFADRFLSHTPECTHRISYADWHVDVKNWENGATDFCSITMRELSCKRLWTNYSIFVDYERYLLRIAGKGKDVRRVFVVGNEVANPKARRALLRTLWRHQEHGFDTKVIRQEHLDAFLKPLDVACDTVCIFNKQAYFMKLPRVGVAKMLSTQDKKERQLAQRQFNRLWSSTDCLNPESAIATIKMTFTTAEYSQVRKDCECDLGVIHSHLLG